MVDRRAGVTAIGDRGDRVLILQRTGDLHYLAALPIERYVIAADGGHLEFAGVLGDLPGDEPDRVGVEGTGQAAIAGDDHDRAIAAR